MGVPKFYRWLSERYPCLSEVVKEYQIPEFDNLYLDMNGIIHNCSHPNDDDVHFRISEEKIFADIFHYLEVLFRMIRPRKVFFMAIDGVAPRAKMNQQRGRRFRSAKEAEDKEKEALAKGEVLPTEQRFDSNCITPGTEFMARLQEQLKYFVSKKISTDPLWQRVRVILSGHQVPGEGEHKIMEFIRYQRSQPDYDVDTRHCLYGLDADLIMLGLCSHEPYFSLLREEVKFGGKKNEKRVTTPESICFHLLHLSLMREYLELEFQPLKSKLPFGFDIERVIDDWVLMGFLVGNDFIPHLPHFHINKGALPLLYEAYMDVLPTLTGYINENGYLNMERFEKFMNRLTQIDYDHFNDIYADVKWLEERHGRKQLVPAQIISQPKSKKNVFKLPPGVRSTETLKFLAEKAAEIDDLLADGEGSSDDNAPALKMDSDVDESDHDPEDESSDNFDEDDIEEDEEEEEEEETTTSDEDKQFHAEFKAHKRNYYMEKLEFSEVDGAVLRDQAEGYVRAIQWILHYYYNGVASWSWFYPYHYAPYVSDIKNFANLNLSFDLGHPFLPYEQLLGVLPSASKSLLPEAFRSLMVSANSPIIEFYPTNFQTDKNGKQQEWEAVVLIPFIDEKRLISAMKSCESRVVEEEKLRNSHGPMQIYVYTEKDLGQLEAPAYFSSVVHNHAQCQELLRESFIVPESKLIKGRHPKSTLERYIPGFPSTRHLSFTGALKKANICVFHMGSLNESMILTLNGGTQEEPLGCDVQEVARQYCGRTIFVNWPHLIEAKVVSIANKETKFSVGIDSLSNPLARLDIQKNSMGQRDADEWRSTEKEIRNRYANRWGIEIGETSIIVYACPIIGRKYAYTQNGRVTLEKQWAPIPVPYVLQATVRDVNVKDAHDNQFLTLAEVFPTNSICFMLGHPGYGLQGRVLSSDKNSKGKVRIEFDNIHEPNNEDLRQRWMTTSSNYFPGYVAAQRLGISSHLLSRITGTVFIILTPDEVDADASRAPKPRKVNVGLNLKFNKRNEEVPGWSRKVDAGWQYSMKTVTTLKNYMKEFPEFFDYIDRHSNCDVYTDTDVFGEEHGAERGRQLNEFVQKLECLQADRQNWGASAVETVALAGLLKYTVSPTMKLKPFVMQVRPHLLYKPDLSSGSSSPDPSANYHLLDRVVNVRIGYSVPLGLRGTVIGIKNAQKMMDTVYEVLFDEQFPGALPIRGCPEAPARVYHVPSWSLINLSHGSRQQVERERQGKPTAVVRPSASSANQRQQPDQSSKYQANKSYKDAVEQPTRTRLQIKFSNDSFPTSGGAKPTEQPKVPVQPKLLTRQKGEAAAPKVAQPQTTATATAAVPETKTAPNPSSLPNPFMDIWNSLLQQHQAATAAQAKASDKLSAPAATEDQQSRHKEKQPIPQAPKLPSLQEAARNLPKITKPAAPPAGPSLAPTPADSSAAVTPNQSKPSSEQPIPLVPPAPPVPGAPAAPAQVAPMPSGPSLSIEQLFQMAGQAPVRPAPPLMPVVFSACAQLMDVTQRKGLGIPLYNYIGLQDGSVVAEIVIPHFGLLARCVGKDRPEASELAAAMALRHPVVMHPMQPVPAMVPHPFHGVPLIQPSAAVPPFNTARPPMPNSFVPLQVVRQSVHHQQKMHHPPPATSVPGPTSAVPAAPPITALEILAPPSIEPHASSSAMLPSTASSVVAVSDKSEPKADLSVEAIRGVVAFSTDTAKTISPAGRTSKPPGSRLAIRFTKP